MQGIAYNRKFYHQTGLVKRNGLFQISQVSEGRAYFRRSMLTFWWIITPIMIDMGKKKKMETAARLRALLDDTQKVHFEPRV